MMAYIRNGLGTVLLLALLAAGCGSEAPDSTTRPGDTEPKAGSATPTDATETAKARVVAGVLATPAGSTFQAALVLDTPEGWHTYSDPPGDSGMPPNLSLNLPDTWQVGDFAYPPAEPFVDAAGTSFGYEGRVVLPFEVRVPANAPVGKVTLAGEVNWLICRDVCLPVTSDVSLAVDILDAPPQPNPEWSQLGTVPGGAGD